MTEYFATGSEKGRGMGERSIALIAAMVEIIEAREHCEVVNKAEQDSLRTMLAKWRAQ